MELIKRYCGNLWVNVDVIRIVGGTNRFRNGSYDEVDSQFYFLYKIRDLVSTY